MYTAAVVVLHVLGHSLVDAGKGIKVVPFVAFVLQDGVESLALLFG
jgi:hypothetical protein